MPPPQIRPATLEDAPAIQAIYAHHVLHGLATFDETPPSVDYIARTMADVAERGLPWVVIEADGQVRAYAYASPYRLRPAYRYTVEDSVYVAPGFQGRGFGKAALTAVIQACQGLGLKQMIAAIGDSANAASIGLHQACGFEHVGLYSSVGFKFGRWVDVVLMQRALGLSHEENSKGDG